MSDIDRLILNAYEQGIKVGRKLAELEREKAIPAERFGIQANDLSGYVMRNGAAP